MMIIMMVIIMVKTMVIAVLWKLLGLRCFVPIFFVNIQEMSEDW